MNINFRSENGFCPYFIYKNFKFYIQDTKDNRGIYVYSLYRKNLSESIKYFDSHGDALKYVKGIKDIRYINEYECGKRILYTNIRNYYVVNDKKVIIRKTDDPCSGDFESYIDCLNFSKIYVSDYIRNQEPEQIKLF